MTPHPPLLSYETGKMLIHAVASAYSVSNMLNKLHGQPESYDKKSKYKFGRTLGAGTYGIVREADGPTGKVRWYPKTRPEGRLCVLTFDIQVAVKIILKKNVKGNEQMVYDELEMLQRMKHPHIVKFVDWFESRVRRIREIGMRDE